MQLSFIFYLLISMATILGSVYFNVAAEKYVSAGLLGAGFLIISTLYGLYMYTPSGDVVSRIKGGPWPPTINVCPDFMSLVTLNGTPVCVDPVGVSSTSGGIQKWNNTGQTGPTFIFDLSLSLSGQRRIDALCAQCTAKGLTWEGVYDGSACLNNQPPIPSGAA
jgi:hypothetical protein